MNARPSPVDRSRALLAALPAALLLASSADAQAQTNSPAAAHAHEARTPYAVRFAIIGDYGVDSSDEADVAALVQSFAPEFVITLGDNNYPDGAADTIDAHIGKYYHDFIFPYVGVFGAGAGVNRFFPALGNHDWVTPGAAPYLAYFTLPGNERYYDFVRGPVHLFAIDSDASEPDGITSSSAQAAWLHDKLAQSSSPFAFVYFHHPPYSSGVNHGSQPDMQWPFRAWGADAVFAGHEHDYERIVDHGFPYFVNGLGGAEKYPFATPIAHSEMRYADDFGAMLADVDERTCKLQFITRTGNVVDTCTLLPQVITVPSVTLIAAGSTWKYLDNGSNAGTAWRAPGFDDSAWAFGPAQLGYGDGDEATLTSFGVDPNAKPITTYFRRSFTVADASIFDGLLLELQRDDGALAYLNGVELVRSNMPAGSVVFTTPASANVSEPEEDQFFGFELPATGLVSGTNVLAVEVHQSSATSSDISFDLRLTGEFQGTKLSPQGAVWKYKDNGVSPAATWTSLAFDDSSWSAGPAQLGYGDGDEATVVGYGPNSNAKYITTWFRRAFTVANAAQYQGLLLRLLRDDGAAVYLNGHEICRMNVPYGNLAASMPAGFNVSAGDESAFLQTYVDPLLLHDGTNVLAVEVHQSSGTSSDISFDLELIGL